MEGADPSTPEATRVRNIVSALPPGIEEERPQRIRHKRHSLWKRWQIDRRVRRAVRERAEPAFDAFRAGLSGELPEPGAGGVILAACNEYYYWHYARALIASIERAGARQAVHLHLCEPGPAVLANIRELRPLLSAVTLSWTVDDCRLARSLQHRTIYYAASRFLLAPLVLERTGAPLLAVDADGIAVRPVWDAYAPLTAGADIAVIERPDEKKPTMKVLASAFGFNPTPEGVRFAGELARALVSIFALGPRYHIDQITIHNLLQRVRGSRNLRAAAMPKRFWDHDFGADAAIWTAKGWGRKDSDAFQTAKREAEAFLASEPTAMRPA